MTPTRPRQTHGSSRKKPPVAAKPAQPATLDDVAALAEVSAKTVSRVVNDEQGVRPATRDRVLRAVALLDYKPNLSARVQTLVLVRAGFTVAIHDDPAPIKPRRDGLHRCHI